MHRTVAAAAAAAAADSAELRTDMVTAADLIALQTATETESGRCDAASESGNDRDNQQQD